MVGDRDSSEPRSMFKAISSTSTVYYTYSSPPRPVQGRPKRYRNNIIRPRGVHDYFNVMWDPHVHRGTTTTTTTKAFQEHESGEVAETYSSDTGKGRRRRSHQRNKSKVNGAGGSYKVASRLTPPPLAGRRHHPLQTEQILEELQQEAEVEETDAVVQTEPHYDAPFPSPTSVSSSFGVDAATQVNPEELFDFEEEIQPVLKTLVAKILEQCLLETMEEEELVALREQQNRFHQTRQREQRELRLLHEQQQRILAEKERFRKHMEVEERQNKENDGDMTVGGREDEETMFSTSILLELLPSVLNSLRQEGFLTNNLNEGGMTLESQSYESDRNPKELEDMIMEP